MSQSAYSFVPPPPPLPSILSQIRRHGYLDQIKTFISPASHFDIAYRKKTIAHYAERTSKFFRLQEQPQYQREKRFNSDFRAFLKGIPQFQAINQQPKAPLSTQLYADTLIYDPDEACEISKNNVQKRKKGKSLKTDKNIFPTSFTMPLQNKNQGRSRNYSQNHQQQRQNNQSRIQILFNNKDEQRTNSILSHYGKDSPFVSKNRKPSRQLSLSKQKYSLELRNTKAHVKKSISSSNNNILNGSINSQIPYINEHIAIQNLNKLTGTDHKIKNYRITKAKLHQILQKRYGHDLIVNFFTFQTIQDFDGILKFVRELLTFPQKLLQLITFMTFDFNRDGVLTEDQIIKVNNIIPVESVINQDIKILMNYVNKNQQLKCEPDLPLNFMRYPTFKQYMKLNQVQNSPEKNNQKIRGIYRFFSFRMESEQQQSEKNQKIEQKLLQNINKKRLRINFEHFQKAYQMANVSCPKFINDLITFLVGKDYNKKVEQKNESPRKISLQQSRNNKKQRRMNTLAMDMKTLQSDTGHLQDNHIDKANKLLKTLHHDQKNLAKVHFL